MLKINRNAEKGKALFSLEGRLDTLTAPELEKELSTALEGLEELTLDCETLEYISSAGLRVLLSAHKRMSRQGEMKLCHVKEPIMEILEVTGFSDILHFC